MALPQPLSLEQIKALSSAALFKYFSKNARYDSTAPNCPYRIQLGPRTLYSEDTNDLREQFEQAVATYKEEF